VKISPENDEKSSPKRANKLIFTLFSNSDNAPLGKEFRYRDNKLTKISHGNIGHGTAQHVEFETLEKFAETLTTLKPHQAISVGRLKSDPSAGVEVPFATVSNNPDGLITRSLKHFEFIKGPGPGFIDTDISDVPDAVAGRVIRLGGIFNALTCIWPELTTAESLVVPSSSSGIQTPDGSILSKDSAHIYFILDDQSKMKELVTRLTAWAWFHDLAYFRVSKAGNLLERSIVDVAVASPERLIYEAPPILRDGIIKLHTPPVYRPGRHMFLPAWPPEDWKAKREAARQAAQPEADKVRAVWIEGRVQSYVARGHNPVEAAQAVKNMLDGGVLHDDDTLISPNGPIRVGDLLDDPVLSKQNVPLADPLEGPEYGMGVAHYLPGIGQHKTPIVYSHAHGLGTRYSFARFTRTLLNEPITPAQPVFHFVDLKTGELSVRTGIKAFFDALKHDNAGQVLICVTVGVGKTSLAVECMVAHYKANPHVRGIVRVQNHKMADQLVADINALAGAEIAMSYRGTGQPARQTPDVSMCRRSEELNAVFAAGGKVDDLCGNSKRGWCGHHPNGGGSDKCEWSVQDLTEIPFVIVAGDVSLSRKLDGKIKSASTRFDFAIIDETNPAEMLVLPSGGFTLNLHDFNFERLQCDLLDLDMTDNDLALFKHGLSLMSAKLNAVKDKTEITLGDVRPARILNGLTEEFDVRSVHNALYNFRVDVSRFINPLGSVTGSKQMEIATAQNALVRQMQHICNAWDQALTDGRDMPDNTPIATLKVVCSGADRTYRIIAAYRAKLSDDFQATPTLILDATANANILRRWWSDLVEHTTPPVQDGPGVFRVGVFGDLFSYSTCVPKDGKDNATVEKRVRAAALWARMTAAGGRAGFIGPKKTLEDYAPILSGVETANYGALRGLNSFENVSSLVLFSRPLPPVQVVEQYSALIHGTPVARSLNGALLNHVVPVPLRDGRVQMVSVEYHPDPKADALVQIMSRDERGLQADGRARGVRRSWDRPVVITALGDNSTARCFDYCARYAEYEAATGWVGTFFATGFWATGRGRALVMGAYARLLQNLRDQNEKCTEGENGALVIPAFTQGLSKHWNSYRNFIVIPVFTQFIENPSIFLNNQIQDNSEIASLITRLDHAFQHALPHVEILGVRFDISQWTRAPARVGRNSRPRVHLGPGFGLPANITLDQIEAELNKSTSQD